MLAAGSRSTHSRRALAALCEGYWYPLYAYVRRKGYQSAEAQDLTQAFFTELLEKDRLKKADQRRGRFRSFLLAALNNFLHNQWRDARAIKRGGDVVPLSLDFEAAEDRLQHEPADNVTPESLFLRRWAMTLLETAMNRLHQEFERAGKNEQFEYLKVYLGGDSERVPYRRIADQLGTTEGAIKVAVFRMRERCRDLLRQEIAETVASEDEIDDELRELFAAVEA